ncbi:hypothetical protein C8J57DRAFT_1373067 [Mycena rebaudengoi]|nr:hypothetical protein C8J57DRAFT_1373067 [Mycena rebaudengoi]
MKYSWETWLGLYLFIWIEIHTASGTAPCANYLLLLCYPSAPEKSGEQYRLIPQDIWPCIGAAMAETVRHPTFPCWQGVIHRKSLLAAMQQNLEGDSGGIPLFISAIWSRIRAVLERSLYS